MSVETVPQRVTIDVSGNGRDDLTEDEIVSLLEELADLRARAVRFVGLSSADEAFSLRLLHRAGNIGLDPVVELRRSDLAMSELASWLDEIHPGALAVPLDRSDGMSESDSKFALPEIAEIASRHGIRLEIDTLVDLRTLSALDEIVAHVRRSRATTWSIRIDPDRSQHPSALLRPAEVTTLFDWIASGRIAGLTLILEELPHFRRYLAERAARDVESLVGDRGCSGVHVLDSRMTLHVSRGGEVFPSRMLRIPAGHVRRNVLRSAFFHHPTFEAIRRAERLHGRCGECSLSTICGGSRARAWLTTGDPLAPDPACDAPVRERLRSRVGDPRFSRSGLVISS